MSNRDSMAKTTHIAVISIPAFSHQASIVEFCRRLIHIHQHFHVTCIFPTIGAPLPATLTLLKSLPSNINYTFLPPVNEQDLPQDASSAVQIQLAVSQSMPSFKHALESLLSTTSLVALIADSFANEALETAKEFNLLSYIYCASSAMSLSLFFHLPALHQQVSCEYRDHKEAIKIPGCVPIQGCDLPTHLQDRSSLAYKLILERSKRLSLAHGFIINSFSKIEESSERALQEQSIVNNNNNNSRVYLIGPVIQKGSSNEPKGSECVRWLENQKANSVLYVSFGSGGTLSRQQLNELAFGLELSGEKFLWVVRAPSDSADGAYVAASSDDPLQFLPDGFLERTKGRGFVVSSWAPQTQILGHASTGGFLTHCGWNSALESIVLGVPMVTWPLFAEQRMNAVLLTEDLKVALRPKFNENDIAEREEIAKVIKGLMVGEEGNMIRARIEKLRDAAAEAFEEDGSSTRALYQLGTQIESFVGQS